MLTGILIGFTVGAGFDIFETLSYGMNVFTYYLAYDYASAFINSIETILYRTFSSLGVGHHYWAAIYGGIYVLFKKDKKFTLKYLFNYKFLISLFVPMCLHCLWNGASLISIAAIKLILQIIDIVLSIGILICLINIGLSQIKLINIYETSKNNDTTTPTPDLNSDTDIKSPESINKIESAE